MFRFTDLGRGAEGKAPGASYSMPCGWTRGRSPAWLLSLVRARRRSSSVSQAPLMALVVCARGSRRHAVAGLFSESS